MFDARCFLMNLDSARDILEKEGAVFKGEYLIHDYIFSPREEGKTIADIFLRLRLVLKNIWDEPAVIVAVKETHPLDIGKVSKIPFKKGFDSEEEARKYIEENFLAQYKFAFDFSRTGWQYFLGDDGIDLEDIEGHPSIEFKSPTEEGLHTLLNVFGNPEAIHGPSVVAMQKILGKS